MTRFVIPIRTSNEQNGAHGHWAAKAKKRDHQRDAARLITKTSFTPRRLITVKMTRVATQEMDFGGLVASLKSVQDGIAAALGIDDGSRLIEWVYRQRPGAPRGVYAVEVEIDDVPTDAIGNCEACNSYAAKEATT